MASSRIRPTRKRLFAGAVSAAGLIPKIAVAGICAATIAFTISIAPPAQAQISIQVGGPGYSNEMGGPGYSDQMGGPEVPGFSNNYPWFNDVPQYQGDQSFRSFLAYHPYIARALSQNPGLLYNADWRSQEPALEEYLASHPYEWQALNGAYWSEGPAETQWGAYDNGQWRDAYWWHQNNPDWFYNNHSNWASLDSSWLNEDGAYDQQNQWHYGEWWYNQDASWVNSNHPNWISQHRNWALPAVQQSYRQQHAITQQTQGTVQPRPSSMTQLNRQQANVQRQASLGPQNTPQQIQRNQQINQQAIRQQQASREQTQAIHQQALQQSNQQQQRATEQRQASVEQQQSMRQDNQRQQQMNRQANQEQQMNRQPQAMHQENQQPQAMHQENRQPQAMHQENRQPQARQQQPQRQAQHAGGGGHPNGHGRG